MNFTAEENCALVGEIIVLAQSNEYDLSLLGQYFTKLKII
jgi:hypothetical protein